MIYRDLNELSDLFFQKDTNLIDEEVEVTTVIYGTALTDSSSGTVTIQFDDDYYSEDNEDEDGSIEYDEVNLDDIAIVNEEDDDDEDDSDDEDEDASEEVYWDYEEG